MLNTFLRTTVLTAFALGVAFPVAAQDCTVNYEMATSLFHPDPGSFAVWQTNYGEGDRLEDFKTLVLPLGGEAGAVAAGEIRVRPTATPES